MGPSGLKISEEGEQKNLALEFTLSRGGRKDYDEDFDVPRRTGDNLVLIPFSYVNLYQMIYLK